MPSTFKQNIDNFSKALIIEMPLIDTKIAIDAAALIKNRIENSGINDKGKSLGTYSENQLPLFFFNPQDKAQEISDKVGKKNIAGEGSRKKKKEFKGNSLSYSDWRIGNGFSNKYVSLNFTGDMWEDTGVVKQVIDSKTTITTVGGKNTKDRNGKTTDDILGFNADRYGDFLNVNKEEEELLTNTYDIQIQKLIDKYFK